MLRHICSSGFGGTGRLRLLQTGLRARLSHHGTAGATTARRNASAFIYMTSACVALVGCIYAAVPLYRTFCQQTGYGGTPKDATDVDLSALAPLPGASPVRVTFVADTSRALPWKFVPEQKSLTVVPGETALAFYSARNEGDREIVGMATYSVLPPKAAQYFNKIQCFCFEEQRLAPGEVVDMPVYFYLDPEFSLDPMMFPVKDVILAYHFFESADS